MNRVLFGRRNGRSSFIRELEYKVDDCVENNRGIHRGTGPEVT